MTKKYKNELYGKQDGKCVGCEERFPIRNLTLDHIVPRAKGGTDERRNLQLLCGVCNSLKGTRSQDDFIQELQRQGVAKPKHVSLSQSEYDSLETQDPRTFYYIVSE